MRDWKAERMTVAGTTVSGYRVACRCGSVSHILGQDMGKRLAAEMIPLKFEQRGWSIGRKPEDDKCPICVKAERLAKRPPTPAPKKTESKMTTVDLPRKPTRDQRRRVMEELDDKYPVAERGYKAGHSDESVAKHLNVPRAWVTELREQLYGPEVVVDFGSFSTRVAKLADYVQRLEEDTLRRLDETNKALAQIQTELNAAIKKAG